ncbi:DUF1905 domain-containing protein [Pontibacter sp. G13]|uniref:DUF1905 domain-containing protein n=1 Tax=Pontibacter sp. G13 TaxID=3074898 RepID=UPI002889BA34|nr:DUF1905 domain-containing protein [Pontibacter sp. G13]WNJ17094.1 DUF1905 domain-containing protein [Pontibacter sp. G13]
MDHFQARLILSKLAPRKGGYHHLVIPHEVVDQFPRGKKTRVICTLNESLSYACGFNHLGNGDFFIIVAKRYLKQLDLEGGEEVLVQIQTDPNPLGVDIPEVLQVLLAQDQEAESTFDQLTDGRKRTLIYMLQRIKSVDLAVQKCLAFLEEESPKMNRSQ